MAKERSALGRLLGAPFTRRAWVELCYVVVNLPLALVGLVLTLVLIVVGTPLSILALGLPLLALGLATARGFGAMHRGLARRLLGSTVNAFPPPDPRPGQSGLLPPILRDKTAWRALAYVVLKAPLAVVTFVVTVACWSYGLLMFSYVLWWYLLPGDQRLTLPVHNITIATWPKAIIVALFGLLLLALAPRVARGLLVVDRLLIRGLLGTTTLAERVRELEQARAHVVDDAAAKLRQIERDLHDGAQVRMVALAMHLGMIKDELDNRDDAIDLNQARALVEQAHHNAKEALSEVRDLARGIHPAALDAGLDPALATLAARSAVPTRLAVDVPDRPSAAIETIAYFCTAELLTNVAKHSGARRAEITVTQRGDTLRVEVRDDGQGGAVAGPGSGLSGLVDRVRTVDGTLTVDSPRGGPTVVTIELPAHT